MNKIDTSRHLLIHGMDSEKQKKIEQSSVLVIGAGGLGTPVLNYLTMAGVKKVTIADFDIIEASNLHRQTLYTQADLGKFKAQVAKDYLTARSPLTQIIAITKKLNEQTLLEQMLQHDIVIDCTDKRSISFIINDVAVKTKTPVVFGNASEMSGQLFVMIPSSEKFTTFRDIWEEDNEQKSECTLGIIAPVAGVMGSFQALQAIKVLSGFSNVNSSALYTVDFHNISIYKIEV